MSFKERLLDTIQEIINDEYEKEGLTDKVLEAQVKLNKIRNKLDTPDKNETIYQDYVQ